jgi:hypothetical protein
VPELESLEQQLSGLGERLDWPSTPNLAPVIRQRIAVRRQWFDNRWAMAAAVALIALAALLAFPPSREAIADWINLHTFIGRTQHLPTLSPRPSGPLGVRLGLGGKTTLAASRDAVSWKVLLPQSLGQPDEVYLQLPPDGPSGGEVTLVYATRPEIPTAAETGVAVLITEARGKVNSNFFGKMLGQGTTIDPVTIDGHSGYWFAGAPHDFFFIDSAGNFRAETLRLATNTLLIDEGGTVVRIEGDLTKDQAILIAQSLG